MNSNTCNLPASSTAIDTLQTEAACACGPACTCGPACQCQPGAACSPACHCAG
jgi:hypothetical protein